MAEIKDRTFAFEKWADEKKNMAIDFRRIKGTKKLINEKWIRKCNGKGVVN